jgi:hypothetical protein
MSMSAHLIYYLRTGVVVGTAAGRHFALPVERGGGADLGSWTTVVGLDLEWELVGYSAGGQRGITTRARQKARTLPHDCSHCVAGSRVVFVDDGGAGLIIHGWPPCNGRRCLVMSQGWETFLNALATERDGSIRVV